MLRRSSSALPTAMNEDRPRLSARSRRLRRAPAASALARWRADRRPVRAELRGRCREQRAARRRGVGNVPVRDHRRAPFADRHLSMESLYEYGARAGVWRVLRLFDERSLPLTIFGVAMALARNPAVVDACMKAGHEIASHGFRWISYQNVDEDVEREHIARAVETIARLTGAPPAGWYTGRDSPRTRATRRRARRLRLRRRQLRRRPAVLDASSTHDAARAASRRPVRARHQRHALRNCAGLQQRRPVLHLSARCVRHAVRRRRSARAAMRRRCCRSACTRRIVGRPGRIAALARFVDHVQRHDDVWIARRIDIARHWMADASLRSAHADRAMSSRRV